MDLEDSILRMLDKVKCNQRSEGISLALAGLNPSALEVVQCQGLGHRLGRKTRVHQSS